MDMVDDIDKMRQVYRRMCIDFEKVDQASPQAMWEFHQAETKWQADLKKLYANATQNDISHLEAISQQNWSDAPPIWLAARPLSFVMIWATSMIERILAQYGTSSPFRYAKIIHCCATQLDDTARAANLANRGANLQHPPAYLLSYQDMIPSEYRSCVMGLMLPVCHDQRIDVCTLFIGDWYVNFISIDRQHRRKSQRLIEGIFNPSLSCALCFGPNDGGLTLDGKTREQRLARCPICNVEHCQACLEDDLASLCIQCKAPLDVEVDALGVIHIAPKGLS